jgi:hypothetical protein
MPDAPTPTLRATIAVATPNLRNALASVQPHAGKNKTGDDQSENRIRLVFVDGWLYVLASNSNGATTALGKVPIAPGLDSRAAGINIVDGPMVCDLQIRQAKLILQQFKAKPADPNADQLIQFEIDLEDQYIQLLDIGGLWSEGESVRYQLLEQAENFPDIIGITSMALAAANASPEPRSLVTDGRLLALFAKATIAYGAPVQADPTGTAAARGFLITVGADFLGTVESRHGDDDSLAKRDKTRQAWLKLLPARKLRSA